MAGEMYEILELLGKRHDYPFLEIKKKLIWIR